MAVRTKTGASKKDKAKFVEKWNKALQDAKPAEKRFKSRRGSRFTLSINDENLHDIIREECPGLFGQYKISGEKKPQDALDVYRAALFFGYGVPLDTPVDPKFLAQFTKAVERLRIEDPDLFKEKE